MGEGQGDRGCSCFGSKPVTFTLTLAQCHVGIPIDAQMSLLDGNHLSAGAVERGARSYDRATRTRCRCSVLRAKSALARHGHGGVKVHDCSTMVRVACACTVSCHPGQMNSCRPAPRVPPSWVMAAQILVLACSLQWPSALAVPVARVGFRRAVVGRGRFYFCECLDREHPIYANLIFTVFCTSRSARIDCRLI